METGRFATRLGLERAATLLGVVVALEPQEGVAPQSPESSGVGPLAADADDDALLADFEKGAPGVGVALYDRLFPVVDGTLYRILGSRQHDHADLVQAAFEQIVMTLTMGRFARQCSLRGWASVVACHIGLSALRSRRRERAVIDRGVEADPESSARAGGTDPERDANTSERLARIRRHLSAMDSNRTTTLLLHAMGYSLREIAGLTRVSTAAAQSRLSRGRRELTERLARDGEPVRTPETRLP